MRIFSPKNRATRQLPYDNRIKGIASIIPFRSNLSRLVLLTLTFACSTTGTSAQAESCQDSRPLICVDLEGNQFFESCTLSNSLECSDLPNCCAPDVQERCPGACMDSPVTNTPTPSPTSTDTPRPTSTNTPQATTTYTATATYTHTSTATPPASTPDHTPQATATNSPRPTATNTLPQATATNSPHPTATYTQQATASNTPPQATATNSPHPTATHTQQATATNTPPQATATNSPHPTATHTQQATATNTPPQGSATNTPPPGVTTEPQPTQTPADTATATVTTSPTITATPPSGTSTPTTSASPTAATPNPSSTPSPTPSSTATPHYEQKTLTIAAECIQPNRDGTYTSYFSYNNTERDPLVVGNNSGIINTFIGEGVSTSPPTIFESGLKRGGVVVQHTSTTVTWHLSIPGRLDLMVESDAQTVQCGRVEPLVSCVGANNVVLGYNNPNPFSLVVNAGPDNFISSSSTPPTNSNFIPPEIFLPGRVTSAMNFTIVDPVVAHTWALQQQSVDLSASLSDCAAPNSECVNVNSTETIGNLDTVALELSSIAQQTAKNVLRIKRNALKTSRFTPRTLGNFSDRNFLLRQRATKRAKQLEEEAYRLTIQLPKVSRTCLDAPAYCITVDRLETFTALQRLYAYLLNMTKRQTARYFFVGLGETKRNQALVVKAKQLVKFGNSELSKLPRFATDCTRSQ